MNSLNFYEKCLRNHLTNLPIQKVLCKNNFNFFFHNINVKKIPFQNSIKPSNQNSKSKLDYDIIQNFVNFIYLITHPGHNSSWGTYKLDSSLDTSISEVGSLG